MPRRIVSIMIAVVLLLSLSTVYAAAKGKAKFGVAWPTRGQIRWPEGDWLGFRTEAEKLGYDAICQYADADERVQANQVENMITQGIDVLILAPVNIDTANSIVERAKKAGVKVVAYNYMIPNADLGAAVTRDSYLVGEALAKACVAAAPKGNYIVVSGDPGSDVARLKTEAGLAVLKPYIDRGDIKIVSHQWHRDWSTESALKQVENALTANKNKIAAVLCNNDTTAYGAIQALAAQNLAGKVFVTGEDAELTACQEIMQGRLSVTNFTPFDELGRTAARLADALYRGVALPGITKYTDNGFEKVPHAIVESYNVDKSNMSWFLQKNPWWIQDPKKVYANAPKSEWPDWLK